MVPKDTRRPRWSQRAIQVSPRPFQPSQLFFQRYSKRLNKIKAHFRSFSYRLELLLEEQLHRRSLRRLPCFHAAQFTKIFKMWIKREFIVGMGPKIIGDRIKICKLQLFFKYNATLSTGARAQSNLC